MLSNIMRELRQFAAVTRRSLSKWELAGLFIVAFFFIGFAANVEIRANFLHRRMTDVEVYFRAAWSARTGHDVYEVTDSNHWHYLYPPTLAVLMAPFAEPPRGVERVAAIPYPVSVLLWYGISVLFVLLAIHWLAKALEEAGNKSVEPGSRRWWGMRIVPLFFSIPVLAHALVRGQVGPLWLLLLCGMIAALIRRRHLRAGLWLAGMICLKLIPAFLLVYPILKRDWRCLAGCALGLVLFCAAIPAIGLGPNGMVRTYARYYDILLKPGLSGTVEPGRQREVIDIRFTDTQSFSAIYNNVTHPDLYNRHKELPAEIPYAAQLGIKLFAGVMLLCTLLAIGWRKTRWAPGVALGIGALTLLMMPLSPVFHPHYMVLLAPALMGLQAAWVDFRRILILGWAHFAIFIVIAIPQWSVLRHFGLVLFETLAFWGIVTAVSWKRQKFPMECDEPRPAATPASN